MKVRSHLFEGCGKWGATRDYGRWNSNIRKAFREAAEERKTPEERDFWCGFCVHCLTDYWNDIKIWKRLQKEHIPPMRFQEFADAYYPEARGIDLWLYQNSKNTKRIREMLSKASAFDKEGTVNKEEIERQRSHLLNVQYDGAGAVSPEGYHFLSADSIEEFIDFAVKNIKETIWEEVKWQQNGGIQKRDYLN